MTTQLVPGDDQPGLQARFRQFLGWLVPISFGLAVLLAIPFVAYIYCPTGIAAGAIFSYGLFLLAVVLLLLLLWQFNSRLSAMLARLRAANAALHDSEVRYRAVSELIADTIYALRIATDGQPTLEWINESFTTTSGYTLADLQGQEGWPHMLHPDDHPISQAHSAVLLAGQPHVCEYRVVVKSGEVRWLRDYALPQWDAEHRRVIRILGASQDITERKHAEDERQTITYKLLEDQKIESLAVLAGGIAHDFNNLLAIILGNTDLARMELPTDSPAQDLLAPIVGAVQRATTLTQQMLAYSGRGYFLFEHLDLNTLLREIQEPIQATLGERVTALYQIAPDLPLIEADASQIRQAVLNLVINAAEAIGQQQGAVTIRTGLRIVDRAYLVGAYLVPDLAEGPYVYLEVADTGSGMDASTRARIFEPFFTTKFTGRGLGLAAVLGIVRGHHGAILVQSAPEQGATFTILLPVTTWPQPHDRFPVH